MVGPLVLSGDGFGLVVAPMVDAILTEVPVEDAGSGSGLLTTTQQVGMAVGVALVGVLFFAQLDHDSGRGVDAVLPGLRQQLASTGVPAQSQQRLIEGFKACVHEWSAATDPTKVPDSCQVPNGQPGADQLQQMLAGAGLRANAHNFSRTFGGTLWYGVGLLVVVCLGIFALPERCVTPRIWTPSWQRWSGSTRTTRRRLGTDDRHRCPGLAGRWWTTNSGNSPYRHAPLPQNPCLRVTTSDEMITPGRVRAA
jgi:hypothetical protein